MSSAQDRSLAHFLESIKFCGAVEPGISQPPDLRRPRDSPRSASLSADEELAFRRDGELGSGRVFAPGWPMPG